MIFPWLREKQAQLEEYKLLSTVYQDELRAATETVESLRCESQVWERRILEEVKEEAARREAALKATTRRRAAAPAEVHHQSPSGRAASPSQGRGALPPDSLVASSCATTFAPRRLIAAPSPGAVVTEGTVRGEPHAAEPRRRAAPEAPTPSSPTVSLAELAEHHRQSATESRECLRRLLEEHPEGPSAAASAAAAAAPVSAAATSRRTTEHAPRRPEAWRLRRSE